MAHQSAERWFAPLNSWRSRAEPCGSTGNFWNEIVAQLDNLLRFYYAISEFSGDPDCILRIGRGIASGRILLMDGTVIEDGDPIGTLHLWNEHLPRYNPGAGPDLAWAADIRRRLVESLQSLAQHAGTDPFWHDIKAFRGEAAFSSRLGTLQLNRVARRHGLECIVRGFSSGRPLRDLGNCMYAYGLARAFNPGAASRQRFFRRYGELWISQHTLLTLYGGPNPSRLPRLCAALSLE